MQNRSAMQIFQPPQNLVGEDFDMVESQELVGDDDFVKIRLHQRRQHVQFVKCLTRTGQKDVSC